MDLFFATAAEAAEGAAPDGGLIQQYLILFGILFAVWYFMLIKPQRKKQSQHQDMLGRLKKGDRVVTIGGIHGLVAKVKENTVDIKIDENAKIEFSKNSIAQVNPQHQTADKDKVK